MGVDEGGALRVVPPLRGRDNELALLRGQLAAVQGGRGGVVLVTGVPGIGKSALLDATAAIAGERPIEVFRGAGGIAAQVIPFGPLLEALTSSPAAHGRPGDTARAESVTGPAVLAAARGAGVAGTGRAARAGPDRR